MDQLPSASSPRRISTSLPRRKSSSAASQTTTLARIFSGLTIAKNDKSPKDVRGQLGLNLLFDSSEPVADIIFVHGLGGGSRKTWEKDNDPQLFWPKEWLSRDPEFKHVRVHSYGYHADWVERRESILNIHDFANSLLVHMQASTTMRRGKQLPIVFVCHSMGGLVVKRALILAQQDPSFQELGKKFNTIYFLATPHHGASSAQLLNALIKATNAGNRPFVNDLVQDSPAIQAINDEFRHFADLVRLYSFFETEPTSIAGVGNTFIVTKNSAVMLLPRERVGPIQANHRGVCKYSSPSDPNYILVRNALVETLDRITETWSLINGDEVKSQRKNIHSFLNISEQYQQSHVDFDEPRVDGSCEWLTAVPSFRQWRDASEPRVFWLNGNPGTGKSFLSRFVVDHLDDLGFDCSYFFFHGGDKLHSSVAGCLMSLAWQMAENNTFIRDAFLEMRESNTQFDKTNIQSIWRTLFVSGIFQTRIVKPQFWVLDGLDECTNFEDMLPLIAKINASYPLQIFLASRPSPVMQGRLSGNGVHAAIYEVDQSSTSLDIELYVKNQIGFLSMDEDTEKSDLVVNILDKSEGSFLWVKLVLKELGSALSVEAIRHVLEDVPKDMNQIYLRSLDPLSQDELRRPAAKAILMWASTCIRPLNTAELKHALILQIHQTFNSLENHISWLCGYLVSVDRNLAVKMAHETARSFLLDPDNGSVIAFGESEAHEALALVCLEYLNDKELRSPRGRKSTTRQVAEHVRSPFFNYAATSFHEHVQNSDSVSEKMVDLLHGFLSSPAGNVLTWIEHIASTIKDLTVITRAGMLIQAFSKRVAKNPMRRTEKVAVIESWGMDLIRIVGKFGSNLLRLPSSIYTMVPPFSPGNSMIHRQYGRSPRGISVLGVETLVDWDDCLATIVYRQKGNRAMSLAATSTFFAVGTSSPFARLYHTSTCQEFGTLHHGESVKIVEFNLSSQRVATAGNTKICLWSTAGKQLLWAHELSRPSIAVTFTTDDEQVVVACQDNRLYYFSTESGEMLEDIPWYMDQDHALEITTVPVAAAFSNDLSLLAFVYRGGHIGIWDWDNDEFIGLCEKPGTRSKRLPFHASSLAFNPAPNANTLAAAYEQGEILVFEPTSGNLLANYKGKTDSQTLSCSPDGRTLISGDSSGVIRVFDFQTFDTPNHKLRLLYIISGVEENISALAFCGNKRFVDIRGPKVKVWEPTVLLRQDISGADTESITSEPLEALEPVVEETDPITSVTMHPNGKHIFCATSQGLVRIVETATGKTIQTMAEHEYGDSISWMIFGKADNILVSATISSKIIVNRLAFKHSKWIIESTLWRYRMGEPIEQLLFNASGSKILVVTTTRDIVYSLKDNSLASRTWDTRLPGVWCNDPRDQERLLLFVNRKVSVFKWDGLEKVTSTSDSALGFDLPANFGIKQAHSGWQGTLVATVYTEVDRARSNMRLLFWDAMDFDQADPDSDAEIMPYAAHQPYGDRISSLAGTLGTIIGLSGQRVLFLDQDGWVCSILLSSTLPETYNRHFFLPFDWLSTNDTLIMALNARNEMAFAKQDELAVIKRGLDIVQGVSLPARSRRSSGAS